MTPNRKKIRSGDRFLRQLVVWLNLGRLGPMLSRTSSWGASDWTKFRAHMFAQGVGAYAFTRWSDDPGYPSMDPETRTWLEQQYRRNSVRVARMSEDLKSILSALKTGGIPAVPIKGPVFSDRCYPDPGSRPLADTDLLVRPGDLDLIHRVMSDFGYRLSPHAAHETERSYIRGTASVVDWGGEHPQNPRPVEFHTTIRERNELGFESPGLTDLIWRTVQEESWRGIGIILPDPHLEIEYLAYHTMRHAAQRSGRLIRLIDLAFAAANSIPIAPRYPDSTWTALTLAKRALPSIFPRNLLVEPNRVHSNLIEWARSVPLDDRCGLTTLTEVNRPRIWIRRLNKAIGDKWILRLRSYRRSMIVCRARHALRMSTLLLGKAFSR